MNSRIADRNKAPSTALAIMIAALVCFGLRIYEDYTTTGRIDIAARVAQARPHTHGIYQIASLVLDTPFALLNSVAAALILAAFVRRSLWQHAFAVGILSELAWVLLWRSMVWGRNLPDLSSQWAILSSVIFAASVPLAAYCVQRIMKSWSPS
jgi:hypothetical protein